MQQLSFELKNDSRLIDPSSKYTFVEQAMTLKPNKKVGMDLYPLLALLHFLIFLYIFIFYNAMVPYSAGNTFSSIKHSSFDGGKRRKFFFKTELIFSKRRNKIICFFCFFLYIFTKKFANRNGHNTHADRSPDDYREIYLFLR